jgi:hypothetical protein
MDRVLVVALRARGVDILTALEAGMIERDDTEHLAFASLNKRVLLTCNTGDFCRLHQDWLNSERTRYGIICMQQQFFRQAHGFAVYYDCFRQSARKNCGTGWIFSTIGQSSP